MAVNGLFQNHVDVHFRQGKIVKLMRFIMSSPSRLLVITLVALLSVSGVHAQSFSIQQGLGGRHGHAPKRPNVLKSLRLSASQREEIVAIVNSLANDTRTLRRKKDMLKEDYTSACLKEKPDESEMQRIRQDIQSTQAEIDGIALKKMSDIKQLLTKTQAATLADLRAEERDRIAALNKKDQGDVSTDTHPQVPAVQSFSVQSWASTNGDKIIDADELFVYPDRDLWLDRNAFGSFSLSSDEGDDDQDPFNQFFNGQGNGFSFHMPDIQRFRQSPGSDNDGDDDSNLMDDTPYTLPKDKSTTPKLNDSQLQKQLDDMQLKLQKLQKELQKRDGHKDDKDK